MAVVYPRKAITSVVVGFEVTCGVCGRTENVEQVVELDLLNIRGFNFDDSLRSELVHLAWPAGWSTKTYWYDESGGPGGYGEMAVCPGCTDGSTVN